MKLKIVACAAVLCTSLTILASVSLGPIQCPDHEGAWGSDEFRRPNIVHVAFDQGLVLKVSRHRVLAGSTDTAGFRWTTHSKHTITQIKISGGIDSDSPLYDDNTYLMTINVVAA